MTDCSVAGSVLSLGECFISINTSSSTESKVICTQTIPFLGPTIETVTIAGYATTTIHIGEAGRAGYSSTLTRKYDCDTDSVRFLCNGEGSSYIMGSVEGLASITRPGASTGGFSCSATSGPASMCVYSTQENGFGMSYGGSPISFSSSPDACTMIALDIGSVSGRFYLQSFNLDMPSGQVPVASYTVTRVIQKE